MAGSTPASLSAERPSQAPVAPAIAAGTVAPKRRPISPTADAWRRFRRHRMAMLSLVVLFILVVAVAFGPLLWKVPINEIDFGAKLKGPSWAHPLGTDDLGQDIL